MSQQTLIAIATMLNAFPQAAGDIDVLVRSFDAATEKMPSRAVCEAAELYMRGEVKGQNLRYAPTVAEFATEVRRIAELHQFLARPRLPAPEYRNSGPAPFQIKAEQLRQKYAAWSVLRDGVSLEEFKAMVLAKKVPTNATWIGALNGSVLVPPRQKAGA